MVRAWCSVSADNETLLSRLGVFVVLGSVTAAGPVSTDIYLPGLPQMSHDLGSSQSAAQLTLTTFLIGMALGQVLAGPLSDVHGRRRPLIAGIGAYAVASFACALSPSLFVLVVMRLVQGTAAAAGMAIGRAIVRDLGSGAVMARYLSRLMLIVGIGPILAPILGGQILRFTSWRGLFVALALLGLGIMVMTAWVLPETLPRERRHPAGLDAMTRTFGKLLVDRSFVGYVLVASFGCAAVTVYIAGSSFVFEDVYGVSPRLYGVLYGVSAFAMVVGAQVNAHMLRAESPRRLLGLGTAMMVIAAVLMLVVALFHGAGFAALLPPAALLMFSWSFMFTNVFGLALTNYPHVAGSASALLGVSMFACGGLFAPLAGVGGNHTVVPMALVVAVCAAAAAVGLRTLVPRVSRAQIESVPVEESLPVEA
jgi:DHA1 family bicyclomycin/chloramphenicol resistance-like MFS transporter